MYTHPSVFNRHLARYVANRCSLKRRLAIHESSEIFVCDAVELRLTNGTFSRIKREHKSSNLPGKD